jgi:hypothetical protein
MKVKEKDYEIENGKYFVLATIIVLLFILMMTIVNLNYYIRKNKENSNTKPKNTLLRLEEERPVVLNPSCIIVSDKGKNDSIKIVEGSLEKAKIKYTSKVKFESITDSELQWAEIIIINGSELGSLGNADMLLQYLKKGKHIIFTSMPDVDYIKTSGLEEIMGIKNITQSKYQKGVKFLPGFMIGGLLEFPELFYNAPDVELLSTTKTYVSNSENSEVIWRNTYGESEIYVVNGPFFETNAGYGILSAIMAQIYPDYIYPAINAKVLTYTGLPYVSYENTSELEKMYSRSAMQLQQDILIPDILSINKSRNFIPSGFLTGGDHKNSTDAINKYSKKQINNYQKDIYKLGGEVGVVYTGDLEKDIETYHDLFNNMSVNSILLKKENVEELNELIAKDQFSFTESILGPWSVKKKSFGYVNESTVYIPFTIDGISNTDFEKLEFYSGITAFGAIIQNLNLEQIIFPKDDKDNWMNVLREYVKFMDSYRMKFQMLEARNVTGTAQSIKKFEMNSPTIEHFNNKIKIRFKEWYGESYYILRTSKAIESITEGTIVKIEDGVYLVTAKNKEVDINLRQIDKYE